MSQTSLIIKRSPTYSLFSNPHRQQLCEEECSLLSIRDDVKKQVPFFTRWDVDDFELEAAASPALRVPHGSRKTCSEFTLDWEQIESATDLKEEEKKDSVEKISTVREYIDKEVLSEDVTDVSEESFSLVFGEEREE